MANKAYTRSEFLGVVEAQNETLQELSERLVRTENLTEKQENRNQNTLYVVAIAAVFIVVTVAVEVLLSNRDTSWRDDRAFNQYAKSQAKAADLQEQINVLKARNPYLK